MTSLLEEISESSATGNVAAIYADIRKSTALPIVNLVFRNMATISGGLEWAWSGLKPLYTHSRIYEAGAAIAERARTDHAHDKPWRDDPLVQATLESYTRGNMINMIGLFVLSQAGSCEKGEIGQAFVPRRISVIMPLPDLAMLPAASMERLRMIAHLTEGDSPLIPSLFRHFANDPDAILVMEKIVRNLSLDGRLRHLVASLTNAGRDAARKFPSPPRPADDIAQQMEKLTALFTPTMARMTILAQAMR